MKLDSIHVAIGVVVTGFVWFLGGVTGLTLAVLLAIIFDYVLAVFVAIDKGRKAKASFLNSQTGFKGIVKKVIMVMCLGFSHWLDMCLMANSPIFKSAFSVLFLGNESISLTKHLKYFGVPIPQVFIDSSTKWTDSVKKGG